MDSPDAPREHALRTFMDSYCEAWNREDLDAILDAYHVPSFTYKYGTLHAFMDAESRRKYVAGFIEVNRQEGASDLGDRQFRRDRPRPKQLTGHGAVGLQATGRQRRLGLR